LARILAAADGLDRRYWLVYGHHLTMLADFQMPVAEDEHDRKLLSDVAQRSMAGTFRTFLQTRVALVIHFLSVFI